MILLQYCAMDNHTNKYALLFTGKKHDMNMKVEHWCMIVIVNTLISFTWKYTSRYLLQIRPVPGVLMASMASSIVYMPACTLHTTKEVKTLMQKLWLAFPAWRIRDYRLCPEKAGVIIGHLFSLPSLSWATKTRQMLTHWFSMVGVITLGLSSWMTVILYSPLWH